MPPAFVLSQDQTLRFTPNIQPQPRKTKAKRQAWTVRPHFITSISRNQPPRNTHETHPAKANHGQRAVLRKTWQQSVRQTYLYPTKHPCSARQTQTAKTPTTSPLSQNNLVQEQKRRRGGRRSERGSITAGGPCQHPIFRKPKKSRRRKFFRSVNHV